MTRKNLPVKQLLYLIIIGILFAWGLDNLSIIWASLLYILKLMMPILIGMALAFILDVFNDIIEEHVLVSKPDKPVYQKIRRPLSVFLSVIVFLAILGFIVVIIMPKAVQSLQEFALKVPESLNAVAHYFDNFAKSHPAISQWMEMSNFDAKNITKEVSKFMTGFLPNAFNSFLQLSSRVLSTTLTVFIGFVFAIYFLLQKETILKHLFRFMEAFLSEKRAKQIRHIVYLSVSAFKNFVTGQMLESIICGTLTYIVLSIFQMPQSLLVAFITGVGALIPMFGAIFATIIGGLIMFISNPLKALIGVLLILIVVQVDGNFIYPHVAGNRLGIPALLLLFSVTILGNLFGFTGMILGVPVMSILYTLITEETNARLKHKEDMKALSNRKNPIRAVRPNKNEE
ncbi:AI-2E family transporter [Guggenheimella bovis]